MSNKLLVTMKLDQRLGMSQQLRQAITLLQYNTLDLKQLVQHYIEQNPLLEVDEIENTTTEIDDLSCDEDHYAPSFQSAQFNKQNTNYYEDEGALENRAIPENLQDHLFNQTLLCKFTTSQQLIAEAIIAAIDEKGYLTMSLIDVSKTLPDQPNLAIVQDVLKTIQTFDPIGVGAVNARESLLIQLEFLPVKDAIWQAAHRIISHFFDAVNTTKITKLYQELGISQADFKHALTLIRTLNPNPGVQYSSDELANQEPELYVKKIKGVWQVYLADSILTNLKVNQQYQALIKQNKKHGSYGVMKKELEEARWLLKGIQRRNETLLAVASYIVKMQSDFLDQGNEHMKSMNINEVAIALDLHESTISRVTTGKYLATPRGVFELKYFFPSHVSTDSGEHCSATAVKALIKEIIHSEEGHALSDGEIAAKLKEKGINIARRTVAKYREAMKILPSYQRETV